MADKQYDITPQQLRDFEEKKKQRLALREEFLKQIHNPHRHSHGGYVFDPQVQRFLSMRVSQYDYFKPNLKTGRGALLMVVFPLLFVGYVLKRDRDEKERSFRSGEVAYRDRRFKFL